MSMIGEIKRALKEGGGLTLSYDALEFAPVWLAAVVEFYDAYKDRYRQGQNYEEWCSSEKRFAAAVKRLES